MAAAAQAFARLSAVYGGTYMLNKPDLAVVYDENGVATGVSSEGATASAKLIVGDPTYFKGAPSSACGCTDLVPTESVRVIFESVGQSVDAV